MPKKIAELREKMIAYARQALLQEGTSALTVRSTASACGVAVGTVYNYFPSKEGLIEAVILKNRAHVFKMLLRVNSKHQQRLGQKLRKHRMIQARHFSLKYVSIPAKKCLAQREKSSLPGTSSVFRYTLDRNR